jgi:hypothetical protein
MLNTAALNIVYYRKVITSKTNGSVVGIVIFLKILCILPEDGSKLNKNMSQ